jgi:hypothetical protein
VATEAQLAVLIAAVAGMLLAERQLAARLPAAGPPVSG